MYHLFHKTGLTVVGILIAASSVLSVSLTESVNATSLPPTTTTAMANPHRASFTAEYAARVDRVVAGILSRGKDLPTDGYVAYLGTVSEGIRALAQKPAYQNSSEVKNITDYIAFELLAVQSSISKGDTFMSDISNVVDRALSSGSSASVAVATTTGSSVSVSTASNASSNSPNTTSNTSVNTNTSANTTPLAYTGGTTGAAGKNAISCNGALPANAVWNYYDFLSGFLGDDSMASYCAVSGGTVTSGYAGARFCGVYQAGMWYPKTLGMATANDATIARMPAGTMNSARTVYQGTWVSTGAPVNMATRYQPITNANLDGGSIDKFLNVACEFSCKAGTAWNGSSCTDVEIAQTSSAYPGCAQRDVKIGNVTWALCDVPNALSVGNPILFKAADVKTFGELSSREKMDAQSVCEFGYHLPTEAEVRATYEATGKDAEFFVKYLRFKKLNLGGVMTPDYGYVTAGEAPYYVTYHDTIYGEKWDFKINDNTSAIGLNFRCVKN